MKVAFYFDENVQRAITAGLRLRGVDVLAEAHRRQREGIFFSGVIYAHQARTSIGECELELIAEATELEELASQILFLPI